MSPNPHDGAAAPFNNPPCSSRAPDWFPPTLDSEYGRAVHGGDIISNKSPSRHFYPAPSHELNNLGSEKQADQTLQPAQHDWPEEHHQLDALDQEMLADARGNGDSNQQAQEPHQESDAELEKSLAWIPKSQGRPVPRSSTPLPLPVVIPQTAPGIKSPFARTWSPILIDHGVHEDEFLQFLDHLNVCKTASPPLQLLNLAGTVVGFTPVPFAFAISTGTSAVATGGMMAVARVRITRYLERVNKEYFVPRALQVRIAKQNSLPQILGQPPDAPLLAPFPPVTDGSAFPSLRDRRMQALSEYIAPIQYKSSSELSEQGNWLDTVSAKMTARSAQRSEAKMGKDHLKAMKDGRKEEAKVEEKIQKAMSKGKQSKVAKLEAQRAQIHSVSPGGDVGISDKGSAKEERAARKFMFVIVQNLQQPVS